MTIKSALKGFREACVTFPMRILGHPFKAFDEMKTENRGSFPFCLFVFLFSCLLNVLEYVYMGFLINYNDLYEVSTLYLMLVTAFPVMLFVTGNWSVTTLLNGKGRYKEIFMAMMYALYPYCILRTLALILSNYLLLDEMSVVTTLQVLGAVIFAFYLFIGLVVIHDYNFSQGVGMVLLTIFAILVIVFILMLGFSLVADVWDFLRVVWREIQLKL